LLATIAVTAAAAGAANGSVGAVYTLTNSAGGNEVLVFQRGADGTLGAPVGVRTGGLGSGSAGSLGSQGALTLSSDDRWLYAVNAGSNEISAFAVGKDGLSLVSKVPSGGVAPISVTAASGLVYVLNAGDAHNAGTISGFRVDAHGVLTPIAGSTRPLSGASVGPAQIQFTPNGHVLVVTEKATSSIDTYVVGADGVAAGPDVQPSAAQTPFGFAFDPSGRLIVSDAVGSAPGGSGLSSYGVSDVGALTTITPFAPDTQTAACWVVTTRDGRFAYTTNTGSASVSSYTIGHSGALSLLNAVAGATGAGPIDAALDRDSRFLYTLDSGAHTVSGFAIGGDGSLVPIAGATGLPTSAVGLAAR
jgi:6-phosphogluconolactonase (cycloisomerase 2 family)